MATGLRIRENGVEKQSSPDFIDFKTGFTLTPKTEGDPVSKGVEIEGPVAGSPIHTGALVGGRKLYYPDMIPYFDSGENLAGRNHAANQIYMNPFISPKTGTIDEILVVNSAGAQPAANFKFAVYRRTSETNIEPTGAPIASGIIPAAPDPAGNPNKTWTFLPPGGIAVSRHELIWIGTLSDDLVSPWGHGTINPLMSVGWDVLAYNNIQRYTSLTQARAFATGFPNPYSVSPMTYQQNTVPLHLVHFSA